MTAIAIVLLQSLASIGFGHLVLRISGTVDEFNKGEQTAISFAMGMGVLGWMIFFVGIGQLFSPGWLLAVLGAGTAAAIPLAFAILSAKRSRFWNYSVIERWIVAGIVIGALFDLAEALAPAADADTLAYHFALPKQFIANGGIKFVPRALDGAIPLLVQMTYIPPLALGGELSLTLWTALSGWALAGLFYCFARRHLERNWALAATLILMTLPAVVFGGGSGQVEVRNALFAILAAMFVAQSVASGKPVYAALAGIAVGFFLGAKFLGLLFAVAAGLAILMQKRWLQNGAALTVAALIAGSQWYIWNYVHTGDPVFPLLFGSVDYFNITFWDQAHAQALQNMWLTEKPLPVNLFGFFAYPFAATFSDIRSLESSRTGFGPIGILVLPFALAGIWRFRQNLRSAHLFPVAVMIILFYGLFFFTGSSQRVRHLLPLFPLLLLCLFAASQKWIDFTGNRKLLGIAAAVTIIIQLGGHGLFSVNYAWHLISGESRQDFLSRNISNYAPVSWINANLKSGDRLYLTSRQLVYLIDIPVYYGHDIDDAVIDINWRSAKPGRWIKQATAQNITYVLLGGGLAQSPDKNAPTKNNIWNTLRTQGCLQPVRQFETRIIDSRAIAWMNVRRGQSSLYKLNADCPVS